MQIVFSSSVKINCLH